MLFNFFKKCSEKKKIARQVCEYIDHIDPNHVIIIDNQPLTMPMLLLEKKSHVWLEYVVTCGKMTETRLNYQNYMGDSALHMACRMGKRKFVRVLLKNRLINVNQRNRFGDRAVDIAKRSAKSKELLTEFRIAGLQGLYDVSFLQKINKFR